MPDDDLSATSEEEDLTPAEKGRKTRAKNLAIEAEENKGGPKKQVWFHGVTFSCPTDNPSSSSPRSKKDRTEEQRYKTSHPLSNDLNTMNSLGHIIQVKCRCQQPKKKSGFQCHHRPEA
jgi:hypothetical protein